MDNKNLGGTEEWPLGKLTDVRIDSPFMAIKTAVFAVFNASSNVTSSFSSSTSASTTVGKRNSTP